MLKEWEQMADLRDLLNKLMMADSSTFVHKRARQKLNFYLIANFIGVLVMLGFGIMLAMKGRVFIPITDLVCSASLLLTYFYLRITKNLKVSCFVAAIAFMAFLLVHLISGGTDSSGPIWFFIFPPVSMYLLGKRVGLILSLIISAPAVLIFMMLSAGLDVAGYSATFILRFLISYLVETFLFYLMESQRSEAQQEVNLLSGLLPICSNCKKIRDDKGYWNNLEAYIEKHSDASFSHGICQECSEALYGDEDWYIEMKKDKENN